MRTILVMLRSSWRVASSYRVNMVISLASLLVSLVPLYFVSRALQPVMAGAIRNEGQHYFPFVLLGMVTSMFLTLAISALPGTVGGTIGNGTFEALLGAPTPLPVLLGGMAAYDFAWLTLRSFLMLTAGWILGAPVVWSNLVPGVVILAMIILAYLPFGLFAAALIIAFRTAGPLLAVVVTASNLLGGVFYPTHVIPPGIRGFAAVVPLTYGLRALRRVLLDGLPLTAVLGDLGALALFVAVLLPLGVLAMLKALAYARSAGTLSQY